MSTDSANKSKTPKLDAIARFTWGALVAVVALLVLGAVFAILVFAKVAPPDLATAFGSIATPVVAIASAYFGIQVASTAANTAGKSAATATDAATSAADAAHKAAGAASDAGMHANQLAESNERIIAFARKAQPDLFEK